jgi:hypothetical protein
LGRDLREKHFGKWSVDRDELADGSDIFVLLTLESWYRDIYAVYATEGLDWDTENLWFRTTLYTQ